LSESAIAAITSRLAPPELIAITLTPVTVIILRIHLLLRSLRHPLLREQLFSFPCPPLQFQLSEVQYVLRPYAQAIAPDVYPPGIFLPVGAGDAQGIEESGFQILHQIFTAQLLSDRRKHVAGPCVV